MAAYFCNRLVFCFYGYKTINGGIEMNISPIIIIVLEYILTLAGAYLFLHAEDFKYKFLGFLLFLIGLGFACVTLCTSTTQMIV